MDLHSIIGTVHAFVEIGDSLRRHVRQRDCNLAVMQGGGTENTTDGKTSVSRVKMELVSDPAISEALCIDFRASVTDLWQWLSSHFVCPSPCIPGVVGLESEK